MIKKINKNKSFLLVSLFIWLSIFLITCKIVPLYDDIVYSFEHSSQMMMPDYSKRITEFGQILFNQSREYMAHNSRTLINILVQSIMMIDFRLYYVLNPCFILLFLYEIAYIVSGKINKNELLICSAAILFSFSYLLKQQVFYWFTGAANYFWIQVLGLLFLLPYLDLLFNRDMEKWNKKFIPILWCVLAFIVGWGTHITSLLVLGTIIFSVAYAKFNKVTYPKWLSFIIISFVLGFVILWAAPSNFIRAENMGASSVSLESLKTAFSNVIKINYLTNPNLQILLILSTLILLFKINKKLSLVSTVVFLPLLFVLFTRNEWCYLELPERFVALIYPDLIVNPPHYYDEVSWNLQYYFYGFYLLFHSVIVIYFLKHDFKKYFGFFTLFFAALCANMIRIFIPEGSVRTGFFSDTLYLILIIYAVYYLTNRSQKLKKIMIPFSMAIFVFQTFNDYQIFNQDYHTFLERKETIEACALSKCDNLKLPKYSVKGYFVETLNDEVLSPHTRYVIRYYGIEDAIEYRK